MRNPDPTSRGWSDLSASILQATLKKGKRSFFFRLITRIKLTLFFYRFANLNWLLSVIGVCDEHLVGLLRFIAMENLMKKMREVSQSSSYPLLYSLATGSKTKNYDCLTINWWLWSFNLWSWSFIWSTLWSFIWPLQVKAIKTLLFCLKWFAVSSQSGLVVRTRLNAQPL